MTAYSAVVRTGGVRGRACVAFNVQRLQPSGTRTSFGGPDDDLFGTLMKDTKAPIPSRSATSKRKPTVIDPVANTTLAWLMSNSCSCCNARWETASRTVSVGHVSNWFGSYVWTYVSMCLSDLHQRRRRRLDPTTTILRSCFQASAATWAVRTLSSSVHFVLCWLAELSDRV